MKQKTELINREVLKEVIEETLREMIRDGQIVRIDGTRIALQEKQPPRRAPARCANQEREREPVRDRVLRSLDALSQRLSHQPFSGNLDRCQNYQNLFGNDPFNGGPRF